MFGKGFNSAIGGEVHGQRRSRSPYGQRGFQRGLSAIEGLVATAIASTLTATAAGHFSALRVQLAVTQTAEAFETDLQLARSMAVARQETIHWTLGQSSQGSCWIVYSGPRQSCRCGEDNKPECTPQAEVLRSHSMAASGPVSVAANTTSIAFDARLGTASPAATVRMSAGGAKPVHQVVNIMGRVRSCVPGGGLTGYRAC